MAYGTVNYRSDANLSNILIVPHATFSVVATILVGLRLYTARHITKTKWCISEYVSIAALVANHILLIAEGVAVHFGYGQDIAKVATEFTGGVTSFLKVVVVIEVTYGIACPLSKISVLAMYYRIFSASRLLRYSTWVMVSMMAGWGIAVVLVSIFACIPIRGSWDKSIPSKCIDSNKFFVGITIPNIVFDVLTVALPVRELWKLQMNRDKKWAITTMFVLGGSVVLASIARLVCYLIYQTAENITQTLIFGHTASSLELCLAIIAACLPPCAPLLKRMLGGVITSVTKDTGSGKTNTLITIGQKSNRRGITTTTIDTGEAMDGSFERLDDAGSFQGSTDGLYYDRSAGADTRKEKRAQTHIRRQVDVDIHVEDIPMRNL
ncbi:integral membrane protein [Fusarium pseudoanthophilum]|uniref:Integral membrane protein n=1 Tax=Fusarium pseudoanthophilum TaxID=48495 RepID=A0A8H5PLC1_9HYPO|nr:integral membrane protein [Fusarium pseudoanthophilum]